ncbi:glycosyltransferase [Aureimonas leprariae]|uniref:Glycosyltransferase family 1 protein n=1 Tax=Plantimonas leprariae TaxID=2615207 RepID=A0A7V7PSS7_9HYPH|nr:glycosyltransferase [Aureimonas leprariae]KAB0682544.1 glycosyltransferase family 1 protein [Aureimonas leprariae]
MAVEIDSTQTEFHSHTSNSPKPLLVCFSHLRWDFVYQRPQHLLSRAADSYQVVFIEEPIFVDVAEPEMRLSSRPKGIVVGVPAFPHGTPHEAVVSGQQRLIETLIAQHPADFSIYWYYSSMPFALNDGSKADVVVFDNMDELSAFLGAPPELLDLEKRLLARADVVFTGGHSLFEAKRNRHGNIHAFPSSIDKHHFAAAREGLPDPADQAGIPHPRVGFFGVVDERMDIEYVRQAAALRPDLHFVMLGPVVKIDPATLPKADNIHWIGGKSYGELPAYLANWDYGFMPFALNESTRFISPTKTPEFLAASVPVVSTAITDVVRPYGEKGLVEIAATPEEFVRAIDRLEAMPRDSWLARVDEHLSTTSWDMTWDAMNREIGKVGSARTALTSSAA